jgi:outer membrane receptor protein involved in Fe transport
VASEMKTQQVPLGINFFHPSGLSAVAKVTYNDQDGHFSKFDDTGTEVFVADGDRFWLCDAAMSYRFPKRYGMVSVGAKNLFDQSFKYFDIDELNPSIQPARTIYAKITLSF